MEKKKKGKGCLMAIIIAFVVLVSAIALAIIVMGNSMSKYDNFDYSDLDLTKVEDGTYTGSQNSSLVKATVTVTVKNHVITDIAIIKHECGKGKPAEKIVKDIVKSNSLNVDAVSGATSSSNIIKMAVYNALKGIQN